MPGVCIHEFFWPLRAGDGRYYQVCRRCGVQCEYDWTTMDRVGGVSRCDSFARRFRSEPGRPFRFPASPQAAGRTGTRVSRLSAKPGRRATPCVSRRSPRFGRRHFGARPFSTPGIPWYRFAETLVGQLVVVAMVLLVSQVWITQDQPRRRSMFENTHLTYYKPEGSFPVFAQQPARVRRYPGNRRSPRVEARFEWRQSAPRQPSRRPISS